MRTRFHPFSVGVLALLLAGCAGTSADPTPRRAVPPVMNLRVNGRAPTIELSSPKLLTGQTLKLGAACNTSTGRTLKIRAPTLTWGEVPAGTAELAVFVLRIGKSKAHGLALQSAATGIASDVHTLESGELPGGAVVGGQHAGKHLTVPCPRAGTTGTYLFLLYAMNRHHALRPGFADTSLFTSTYNSSTPFGAFVLNYETS
jgi:phosphatidylethanolamine-binding protein (PEBP) family uncharacterized protein